MNKTSTPALEISGLNAWYGESHVLHGMDLVVHPGEVVTLLGRNGAGRTSTLRAIMGLTGSRKGSIKINGTETSLVPNGDPNSLIEKIKAVAPDLPNLPAAPAAPAAPAPGAPAPQPAPAPHQ